MPAWRKLQYTATLCVRYQGIESMTPKELHALRPPYVEPTPEQKQEIILRETEKLHQMLLEGLKSGLYDTNIQEGMRWFLLEVTGGEILPEEIEKHFLALEWEKVEVESRMRDVTSHPLNENFDPYLHQVTLWCTPIN